MGKKRTFALLGAIIMISMLLAMPVSAQQMPEEAVAYSDITIEPYWDIANYATLDIDLNGSTAVARISYSKPSSAKVSMRVIIYSKAPGSKSWTRVASSSSASASCSTREGYQYKATASLTLTMNGKKEVIPLSAGPYTA